MAVEISRRDIVSDEIVELGSEARFLKLPIAPYMELLNVTPLPSQVAIINAVNNPNYRFISAAGKNVYSQHHRTARVFGAWFKYLDYVP
mgnify:CR=1 FL=1